MQALKPVSRLALAPHRVGVGGSGRKHLVHLGLRRFRFGLLRLVVSLIARGLESAERVVEI